MKKKVGNWRKVISFIAFLIFFTGMGYFVGKIAAGSLDDVSKITLLALALLFVPIFLS